MSGSSLSGDVSHELRLDGLRPLALGDPPTPVRELQLGLPVQVWLKDDGAYSCYSGNKARKLEWLLADALRRGKRTILTGGAIGTNHGLATALFARELGLRTVLVLVPQPEDEHVRRQRGRIAASGAEVHVARRPWQAYALAAGLMLRRASPPLNLPYFLPPGGSVPVGTLGYVQAGLELGAQVRDGALPEPSHVVLALGTGGTAAGLVLGLRLAGLRTRVVAVLVNDVTRVSARGVVRLALRTQRYMRRRGSRLAEVRLEPGDVTVERRFLGPGYGHATEAGAAAARTFAREGVTLEPVYTAKAAAALLALAAEGALDPGPVLFWQTYHAPGDAAPAAAD